MYAFGISGLTATTVTNDRSTDILIVLFEADFVTSTSLFRTNLVTLKSAAVRKRPRRGGSTPKILVIFYRRWERHRAHETKWFTGYSSYCFMPSTCKWNKYYQLYFINIHRREGRPAETQFIINWNDPVHEMDIHISYL